MDNCIETKEILVEAFKSKENKILLSRLFPKVFDVEEKWVEDNTEKGVKQYTNTLYGVSFKVGDEITIKDSWFHFGDGVRKHTISDFVTYYGDIYASFVGYSYERMLSLDKIVKV